MSPFRSGDENYPPTEQVAPIKNLGLTYPPTDGADSDDAGKDFVNVHLDFFPEDYTAAQQKWAEFDVYRDQAQRLSDLKLRHLALERDYQNKLDAGADDLLNTVIAQAGFVAQAQAGESVSEDDSGRRLVPAAHLPAGARLPGMQTLRTRLDARDKKWQGAHKNDFDQRGVEVADGASYDFLPDNVMAPIIINSAIVKHYA